MNPTVQIEQNGVEPVSDQRIEEASINAWPALQQLLLDGWLLRFTRGFTKRANSIIPLYPGQRPLPDKVRFCENLYARERLKTIFRLTSIRDCAELDAFLENRGYAYCEPTEVLVRTLGPAADEPALRLLTAEQWLQIYSGLSGISGTAQVLHGTVLRGIRLPTAFGVIGDPAQPLACGLAVLEQDLVGLFDVVTAPDARRSGVGTRLVTGLLDWGRQQGATHGYLQVLAGNEPARALYRKLGFGTRYRYWYRISG